MASIEIQTVRIQGVDVALKVEVLAPGDGILLEYKKIPIMNSKGKPTDKKRELLPGQIIRSNAKLRQDTHGQTECMVYQDIYSLARAGLEIVKRYGIRAHSPLTEVAEIQALKAKAINYVSYLVYLGRILPEERGYALNTILQAIADYGSKRAPRKVVARERLIRGTQTTDTLGRNNPAAAGMSIGAAIGHLDERLKDIKWISRNIDLRTVEPMNLIHDHMRKYWELWIANSNDPRLKYNDPEHCKTLHLEIAPDAPEVSKMLLPLMLSQDSGYRACAIRQLLSFREAFEQMNELPFRRSAAHTIQDIDLLILCIKGGLTEETQKFSLRMHQGIRWIFASHVLQMNIILPLSALLNDLQFAARKEHARGFIPRRVLAPEKFQRIEDKLADFETRFERASNIGLDNSVKPRLVIFLREIRDYIAQDNWLKAYEALKAMASIL